MDEVCVASKLGKEIQICEANLTVLLLQVCDEPVETGRYICMELGGKDVPVRWRKPRVEHGHGVAFTLQDGGATWVSVPPCPCVFVHIDTRGKRKPVLLSF